MPLFLRITLNGEKTEVSTVIYIAVSAWKPDKGIKGKDSMTDEKNKAIEPFRTRLFNVYNTLIDQNLPVSAELQKKRFNNKDEAPKTLLGAISITMDWLNGKLALRQHSPHTGSMNHLGRN